MLALVLLGWRVLAQGTAVEDMLEDLCPGNAGCVGPEVPVPHRLTTPPLLMIVKTPAGKSLVEIS
ncbi:MAG: hypothetical protein ACRDWY_08290 [Actinomycetes bacterium]